MNIKSELQKMSVTDLRSICRELGVSCPMSKENIIKRLLDPLKMEYRMHSRLTLKTPTSSSSSNKTPSGPRSGGSSNKLDESIKEPVDIDDIIFLLEMLLQTDNLYDYKNCIKLANKIREIYNFNNMFYFKIFFCYMSSVDNGRWAKRHKKDFKRIDILRRRYFHSYWIKDILTSHEKKYIEEIAKIIKKNIKNNRKNITGTKRKR